MLKRALIAGIRFYRKALSPLKPPVCRFEPTCSAYAIEAIERYGAFRGGTMGVWRILRCQPFSRGGYDPVPLPDEADASRASGHIRQDGKA